MGVGDVVKKGWHPKGKDGGKESFRGDFKGINQLAGWMGRGKDDTTSLDSAHNHSSKPLSALQDPSSFGPPPKHRDYYGEQAAATSIPASTSQPQTQASQIASARHPPIASTLPAQRPAVPAREPQPQREEESPEIPAGPFRVDTTGLSTANLPPPPRHYEKRLVDTPPRSPVTSGSPARTGSPALSSSSRPIPPPPPARSNVATAPVLKPKPNLPPRVPPRTAVAGGSSNHASQAPTSPPPPYSERPEPGNAPRPEMSELEQRLAKMRAKVEPPATAAVDGSESNDSTQPPPPLPLSTKPR